ncbi:MAG TPA: glycosyltransferase family 2 protein [Pyrinomonadaceae bacterium]|nr:glycosyltransferase family 2 protein [Pyrinomonadaceae bacterium]
MPEPMRMLSVIIPVYNEESTITEVIAKAAAVELPIGKEIIVIDDGSTDGTAGQLSLSGAKITRTHLATVNSGKGAAVRIGISLSKGDIILIQDADLELDPTEYRQLIQPILDGRSSVVYGSRFLRKNPVPFFRRLANQFLTHITNLLFQTNLTDMETAYKVFTADVAAKLRLTADRFDIEPEITAQIALLGFEILEVPITYHPRSKLEGKKIRFDDGLKALYMLVRCRWRGANVFVKT